jgi:hypothetical protein
MLNLRVVFLSAPTSLASIMVIDPHNAAATHVGGAPKRGSRSTWFGRASQLEIGLSSCVLVAISPHRAKLGGRAPRDAPGRHPSADPRRWRPAGGTVAGAGLAVPPQRLIVDVNPPLVSDNSKSFLLKRTLADWLIGVLVWQISMDRCS